MNPTDNATEPAYPIQTVHATGEPCSPNYGLTKREAFAMAAMQGLCANPDLTTASSGRLSCMAVEIADSLLAELAK